MGSRERYEAGWKEKRDPEGWQIRMGDQEFNSSKKLLFVIPESGRRRRGGKDGEGVGEWVGNRGDLFLSVSFGQFHSLLLIPV